MNNYDAPSYYNACCKQTRNVKVQTDLDGQIIAYHCDVCGCEFWVTRKGGDEP